ncbi:LicD family protein [Vibrio fortis]|jgi:lipopolysaccharide cholinephosphotransferase|uniref:LicD family protein n=1 Tax=Vibrio fortis TaxID=212667 RepID=UPI0021C3EC8F|nr:LicD family protein [Vibrio fortis]
MNQTRELQLHQIKILKQVIQLFEDENLTYFAIGGTALGAVRHKGFIPWDDDIDIGMPRKDYDKFLTLQDKLPDNLFIQNYHTEKEYSLYITKVRDKNTLFVEERMSDFNINHGIFIDVFPWDEVLEDATTQKKCIDHSARKFRRCLITRERKKNLAKLIKTFFYKFMYGFKSSNHQYQAIDSAHRMYNGRKTGILGNAPFKDAIHIDDLYPLQYLPFEDMKVACPKNIEKYLKNKYGDYMKIPEEKDRICHNPIEVSFNLSKESHDV